MFKTTIRWTFAVFPLLLLFQNCGKFELVTLESPQDVGLPSSDPAAGDLPSVGGMMPGSSGSGASMGSTGTMATPNLPAPPMGITTVYATVETTPVPSGGDAADDVAIWVHPTDVSMSAVVGTNKQGGGCGLQSSRSTALISGRWQYEQC